MISNDVLSALIGGSVVAIAATALRFWCQAKNELRGIHSFYPDDWFLLATVVSFLGAGSVAIYGLVCGNPTTDPRVYLSGSLTAGDLNKHAEFSRALFIGQMLVFLTFFLAKLTVCLLYRRLFAVRHIHKACLYLIIASTVWFIIAEVTAFCICLPLPGLLSRDQLSKCWNLNYFALVIGILEVMLDITILILPIKVILGLHMPRRTKLTVSCFFLMGVLSVLTNILRISYQFVPDSPLINMKNSIIWCAIHGAVTIVCACLPVYAPVKEVLGRFFLSLQEKYAHIRGRLSPTQTSTCETATSLNARAPNMRETETSVVDEAEVSDNNKSSSEKVAQNQSIRLLPTIQMVPSRLFAAEDETDRIN